MRAGPNRPRMRILSRRGSFGSFSLSLSLSLPKGDVNIVTAISMEHYAFRCLIRDERSSGS